MAEVQLHRITKRFSGMEEAAVDEVSLTVEDGEFMVLLGPSGCGKSTTLRMIAGLESITSGMLTIDGREMNDVAARDRDIAMVFQSYALYPHMNVRDNLAFGLRRRRVPRAEILLRVNEVAEMLGLGELLERRPHALSGGQRQRVALGRAIVRDPKVFLFDEPLSNLDAALRSRTRADLVRQYNRLRATMIYVTHDQVEAMTMGTRICVMNRGRVAQVGAPLEVYHDPADTFVASFIGSPPTNLLAGEVSADERGVKVRALGAEWRLPWHAAADLSGLVDSRVVLGIRPECISLAQPADGHKHQVTLSARALMVEPLGAETVLTLSVDGEEGELIARVVGTPGVHVGDLVGMAINLDTIHLFDPHTTRALPRSVSRGEAPQPISPQLRSEVGR